MGENEKIRLITRVRQTHNRIIDSEGVVKIGKTEVEELRRLKKKLSGTSKRDYKKSVMKILDIT